MPIPTENTQEHELDGIEIRSPNRPFPRSAIQAIKEETEIKGHLDPPEGYSRQMEGIVVTEMPSDDTMEQYELSIVTDPDLIYETDHNEEILIYTDLNLVITDGRESHKSPKEIIKQAQELDHVTLKKGDPENVLDNQ